jgi:hypothetical protein
MTRHEKKTLWVMSRKTRVVVLAMTWLAALGSTVWWGMTGQAGVMLGAVTVNSLTTSWAWMDWAQFRERLEVRTPAPGHLVHPDRVRSIRQQLEA